MDNANTFYYLKLISFFLPSFHTFLHFYFATYHTFTFHLVPFQDSLVLGFQDGKDRTDRTRTGPGQERDLLFTHTHHTCTSFPTW